MISYDNYKNRIEKLAKFRRIVHKFRFLICGVLALLIGASVALMCAKGVYTSDMSLSAQSVMFNEEYEITAASAFLSLPSEQHVEYRGEDGEWTREKPVKAGKYSARTVTKKIGGYSYSSAVDFEIMPLPAKFTILSESVFYGDLPDYRHSELVSGHKIDAGALEFDYKEYGAAVTEMSVKESSIKVIGEDGEDYSNCYDWSNSEGKELTVKPRNITVIPAASQIEYDGKAHFAGNEVTEDTLKSLVKGDELTVTTGIYNYAGELRGGAVDARVYNVSCKEVKITRDGQDISNWYKISSDRASQLIITRRKVTITTGDAQKEYDGTPVQNLQLKCENLVENHDAAVNLSTLPGYTDAGTYKNEFEVTFSDGSTDVTGNYEIDKENSKFGTLTITPRPIVVKLSAIYGVTYGKTFAYKDEAGNYANSPDLANGEKLKIAVVYKQNGLIVTPKNVGTYSAEIDLENCTFYKADGTEIEGGANNYVIESTPLENLAIKRFEFIIKPLDLTKASGAALTYGDELSYPDYIGNYSGLSSTVGAYDIAELPYGEQIKIFRLNDRVIDQAGSELKLSDKLNVGKYKITAGNIALFDSDGKAMQFNANYTFVASEFAELEVVPREITVTINQMTSVYGEELPAVDFALDCGALPNDEKLTFTAHYEMGGVTCVPETWEEIYTLLNAGTYTVVCNDDAKIVGGNASTDNYEFEFVSGTLKITARGIIVTTATDEKVYDGKPLENDGYTTVWAEDGERKGLLKGAELIKDTNNTVINPPVAGPYRNVCYYKAPNSNYEIVDTKFGTLTIKPRPVIVYTGSATKPYDGAPLTCEEYADVKFAVQNEATGEWVADDSKVGLIEGDELTLKGDPVSITDAGETSNANRYENDNYDVKDYVDGTLEVTKKHLEIATREKRGYAVYGNCPDGYLMAFDKDFVTADGKDVELPDGQWFTVYFKIEGTDGAPDVGVYTLKAHHYEIYSSDDVLIDDGDSLENYTITCADSELEIIAYSLAGKVNDKTAVYGDKLPANGCYIEDGIFETKYPLDENIEYEFAYDRDVKNVGEYEITVIGIKVYDKDGNLKADGAKNYDFSNIQSGTLTVTAREITIQPEPSENIHYGEELPELGYKVIAGEIVDGDIITFDYAYYLNTVSNIVTPKNVGNYGITAVAAYLNDAQIAIASDSENYDITVKDGSLYVDYAQIGVKIADITVTYGDEWTYDGTNPDIVYGQLYYGETLEVAVKYEVDGKLQLEQPKNVGEYVIELDYPKCKFYNEDGTLCEETNYVFVLSYDNVDFWHGTLTIDKKQVRIKLTDSTRTYGFVNAVATESNFERTDGSDEQILAYDEVLWILLGYKDGGKELTKAGDEWRLSAGDYTMHAAEYLIGVKVSENTLVQIEGGLNNYDIVCEEGTLTVEKYAVKVKPNDRTCVYGTPEEEIEDTGFEYTDSQTVGRGGLPYGENLILSYSYDPSTVAGVGSYAVKATATGVDGGYLTNYAVSYEDGELTVTKKQINIILENKSCTYGEDLPENSFLIKTPDREDCILPYGDEFVPLAYSYWQNDEEVTPKNAGSYHIRIKDNEYVIKNGADDVTHNYIVVYTVILNGEQFCTLTINKKTVTVELNQIKSVYYGETFSYAAGADNYDNFETIDLAYNERLEVAVEYLIDGVVGTPKNANQHVKSNFAYSARLKTDACTVYESDGVTVVENGVDNYNFICEDLEDLTIRVARVKLTMLGIEAEYGDFGVTVDYPYEIGNYEKALYATYDKDTPWVEGLPYGEQFKLEVIYQDMDYRPVANPVQVGRYLILAKQYAEIVYDSEGNEIEGGAYNYVLLSDVDGVLEIVPRKISIQLSSFEIEYGEFDDFDYPDGAGNYDIDNSDELVYGQTLEVGFMRHFIYKQLIDGEYAETTPKDVGAYQITFKEGDYVIFDGDETAYDDCYDVTFIPGTLTIKRKEIKLVIDDQNCTYGDELPENAYKIYDGEGNLYELPYGDEFAVTAYYYSADSKTVTPRNAGSYGIEILTHAITNDGEDVTANYLFAQYTRGTLTIEKADLKLQLIDVQSAVYGDYRGYPSGKGNFDADKTVGVKYGDNFELAVEYEVYSDKYLTGLVTVGDKSTEIPTNAAWYHINLVAKDSIIHTTKGEQFALEINYNVECEYDSFIIYTRPVRVKYTASEYTYGETVEKPEFTIEVVRAIFDQVEISKTELPYGEICDFDLVYENVDGVPVNAGYHYFHIAKAYVNGSEELAKNYGFGLDTDSNYVKIDKKQIEITLDDMSATYGDFEFTIPETHTFTPTAGVLEYTDELTVHIGFTQVGAESTGNFVTPENAGIYSVVATQFAVTYYDGSKETAEGDALKNYEIVCKYGTLEITPKKLHIELSKDVSVEYGQALPEVIPYTITSEGEVITRLPYGQNLAVSKYYDPAQPANAGEYTIVFEDAAVELNPDDPNYVITGDDGLLTITAKEIEVTIKGGTAVYGYTQLPEIAFEITSGEMVGVEKLVPASVFSLNGTECDPINKGTYDIKVDEENTTVEGGNELYSNYKVTYVYEGKLEITASPLTVKIIGDSFTYCERAANPNFQITEGELFHGDELELTYFYDGSEEEPTAAGTYAISATAEIVGGNASVENYEISYVDDDPTLTISKRGIEVKLNQGGVTAFTYGDDYGEDICNAEIKDAASGHIITVAVTYAKKEESSALRMFRARTFAARSSEALTPKDAGTYIASLDFDNCLVTDADGNPVDGGIENYELKAACASVEFVIAPMALTVTVDDSSITYGDNLPAALGYGVAEQMPYGESLELTFSFLQADEKLPVHKGDYPVSIADEEVNGGKISNYKLNYTNENPTLTINAKSVEIQLSSFSRSFGVGIVYEVKANNHESADVLVNGDELTVTEVIFRDADGTEYTAANPPVNVGTYAIVYVSCSIVNADGEDATADYSVTGLDGELIIDSSLITVYTASAEKEYDGTALSTDEYDHYDGDLRGYFLVADTENICERIDATDEEGVDNTTGFKIVDADGNETENLKLQYGEYGKLVVTPKKVNVTIKNASTVYGEFPEIKHDAVGLIDGEQLDFEVEYFKDGAAVTADTASGYFVLPVGTYVMKYAEASAIVTGGRGNASNYDFEFNTDAQIEVTPRHIAITTASETTEYTGSAFSKTDGYSTEWVLDGKKQGLSGLINGDSLTVDEVASRTEIGSSENACTYTASDNYEIETEMYAYGTLTVTKRSVTAKTADVNETYDGEAHSGDTVTDPDKKLAEGHEVRAVGELVAPVDVCSGVENVLTVIIVDTNDGDKDVTDNYNITYDYGKITIDPRPLEITTGGLSGVTYDGKPHGNDEYEEADGLLTDLGHELVVDTEFTYTNATEGVDNKTEYKVYADGKDISGNYNISYVYGKIVIGKMAVTVTLNDGVQVEYGDDKYAEKLTENAVTLVNGETAEIAVTTDRTVSGKGNYTASADWSKTVVKDADGNTVANGADNYAPEFVPATVQFEVIPREIKVTLNAGGNIQFAYGDDYDTAIRTVAVDRMVGSETLKVAVTYDVSEPKYLGEYVAMIDESGCEVVGGDFANYEIILCYDVDFEIIEKEITVDMDDMSVPYGETPAYPEGASGYKKVEGLAYGDTITVIPAFEKNGVRVTPDFAGEYDIVCDGIVVNGGAVDAENYTFVTGVKGKLTVEGVGITVVRKTVKKTYDGTPLALSPDAPEEEVDYEIKGGETLREGYVLVLDGTFATADGNVSSSCANTAEYKVIKEATGETAGEYVVSYEENGAMLVIEQKFIEITTDNPEAHTYDGTPFSANGWFISDGELVTDHVLTTSNPAKITDAGSIDNTMDVTITADGEDVTANYDINVICGTLTVSPLPVSVEIADITKIYGENLGIPLFSQKKLLNSDKLLYSLEVRTKSGELCDTASTLPAGEYVITCDKNNASVIDGKISNYDVSFVPATLTIEKRHIAVTTATASRVYNGEEFFNITDYTTNWVKDGRKQSAAGLVGSDKLTITDYTKRVEEGSEPNVYVFGESANYVIEESMCVNGTLTVTKRNMTVTTNDINGTYDGLYHSNGGVKDDGNLLSIHEIVADGEIFKQLDAVENGKNEFAVKVVDKESGEDVTKNYEIKYNYGKVNIAQCELNVTLNKGGVVSFDYGTEYVSALGSTQVSGLVDGETLTVALVYNTPDGKAPVNAGSYKVSFDAEKSTVSYEGEGNGLRNYDVKCADVNFTIARKNVTLSLGDVEGKVYDGKTYAYDTAECSLVTALFNGETLNKVAVGYSLDREGTQIVFSPKNAGSYYVFLDTANTTVNGANGETAIGTNYVVSCDPVEFTITRRKLVVYLFSETTTYDGEEYVFGETGFTTNACEGDEIPCTVTYGEGVVPRDAGDYTVTYVFDGEKCSNYELDTKNSILVGSLTIKKRSITVSVNNRDTEKGDVEYTKSDMYALFVGDDLDKVEATFEYYDEGGNKLEGFPADVGVYTVSVVLDGDVMKNYDCKIETATLVLTERKVLVTPVFLGTDNVYNGKPFEFGFTHTHFIAGADEDEPGFIGDEEFTAKYSYTDSDGRTYEGTPKNAGFHVIFVELSGEGLDQYDVTYYPIEFTIEVRRLDYTLEITGETSFLYNKECPEPETQLHATNFAEGDGEEYTCELFKDGAAVTRYDVGTYDVFIRFENMENYLIIANPAQLTITKRTIVVVPNDPYGGSAQSYTGKSLKLGAYDRNVYNNNPDYIGLADGDSLTVESNEIKPTAISGTIKITKVNIMDAEGDVSNNYNVIYSYNRADATIQALGLENRHFAFTARYEVREIEYRLDNVGTQIPYDGKTHNYQFGGAGKLIVTEEVQQILDSFNVELRVPDSVTVPAAAGDYTDLITKQVYVYDKSSNSRLAVFTAVCKNAEDNVISVVHNVVSVNLSGLTQANIESVSEREVTFENALSACKSEVRAYNLDGKWLIGITLFSENASGSRTDLSANYLLDENCTLGFAEVKIITLAQAATYALPEIKVEITVNDVSGLYTFDGDSRWVLDGSAYNVTGELQEGHQLQVLVFRDNDNYLLGVSIYSDASGRRTEAGGNYRVVIKSDIAARYVATSEMSTLKREINIGFANAEIGENGEVIGYDLSGLSLGDSHVIEIKMPENGDGTSPATVAIYQLRRQGSTYKKVNMADRYEFNFTLSDRVTKANVVTGTLN